MTATRTAHSGRVVGNGSLTSCPSAGCSVACDNGNLGSVRMPFNGRSGFYHFASADQQSPPTSYTRADGVFSPVHGAFRARGVGPPPLTAGDAKPTIFHHSCLEASNSISPGPAAEGLHPTRVRLAKELVKV